jgi:predicted aldo/keto reductase-like oxidoreductase
MQYRDFGKLGFQVSALGMGCMRLPRIYKEGQDFAEVDREKAFEMIRYAVEHGINYFDTAYGYHNGTSESVLGEALDNGSRQKVKIATKQPLYAMETQADIRRNLENTLKKLRTDYIDLYLIHNIQSDSWDEVKRRDIIGEFEKFRDEKMIRAVGFSYHGGYSCFAEILEHHPWDMCQVQQNMLDVDREVTQQGIRLAGEKKTALVIMEPLRGGGLANASAPVQAIYDSYPEKRTPAEWAFRQVINHPEVSCILSGMSTLQQLKENIALFSRPDAVPGCLSDRELTILKKAKAAYESVATVPCTACEYCLPCPSGVDIPGIFFRYNSGNMFGSFNQPKRSYLFLKRQKRDAARCIECGACEKKCPQHIDIIRQLKVAHASLDGWIE